MEQETCKLAAVEPGQNVRIAENQGEQGCLGRPPL
jgi:hypothetical protein